MGVQKLKMARQSSSFFSNNLNLTEQSHAKKRLESPVSLTSQVHAARCFGRGNI
jgi:hypothetical protein